MPTLHSLLKLTGLTSLISTGVYFVLLGLLTFPAIQTHILYLHLVTLTWTRDLNIPEQFGFLRNQVTPFIIPSTDDVQLHAWHILPLDLYRRHETELINQPAGPAEDITLRRTFHLLRDDPQALLVISLHGTSGTIGSGWRPDNYRALSSAAPDKIHVLALEYRGYGLSPGTPSEPALLQDALAATQWALTVAGIPPSRIVISGQSLGTAVAIALAEHSVSQSPPITFAGLVLVATFSDVPTLAATYRLGGLIPVMGPIARWPALLNFFLRFLHDRWMSAERIGRLVRECERLSRPYHVTFIHAEDDPDIPCRHTEEVFWRAVDASRPAGLAYGELEAEDDNKKKKKKIARTDLGDGGWCVEARTGNGVLREHVTKYGVHDKIMSHPVVGMAVRKAFEAADPGFGERS